MRYSTCKDLNKVITTLVSQGWTVEHNRHLKLRPPGNLFLITCSVTPSCPHAFKRVLADIKRKEREAERNSQKSNLAAVAV